MGITPVHESSSNSFTISVILLSYNLSTSHYNMFLFINDTLNTNVGVFINNGTLVASCNGGIMTISTGYFTSTNCTTALAI